MKQNNPPKKGSKPQISFLISELHKLDKELYDLKFEQEKTNDAIRRTGLEETLEDILKEMQGLENDKTNCKSNNQHDFYTSKLKEIEKQLKEEKKHLKDNQKWLAQYENKITDFEVEIDENSKSIQDA